MMPLRRLTVKGIDRFQTFIDSQTTEEPEAFDPEVVNDPEHSEVISNEVQVPENCAFQNRFEAAEAVAEIVDGAEIEDPQLDRGLWCWLSWVWFESICPVDKTGQRRPRAAARWIASTDYDRYYRHQLAGPWSIYHAHRDNPARALSLLCTPVTKPGDLVEQIASRQELVSNPGLVETVTRLYYDPEKAKHRSGHSSYYKINGKSRGRPGTIRRFIEVMDQLDLIWDLYATPVDDLMELIPDEFDRFAGKSL